MAENENKNYSNLEIAKRVAKKSNLGTNLWRLVTMGALVLGLRSWYADSQRESAPVTQTLRTMNKSIDEYDQRISTLEKIPQPGKSQDLSKYESDLRDLRIGLTQNYVGDCMYENIVDKMNGIEEETTLPQCIQERAGWTQKLMQDQTPGK